MAESMQGLHRTCRCAEVTKEMIGKEVVLMGWVQKARDKGGIIFVDLRDRSGIMQLIFENGSIDEEGFAKAGKLRSEFVIAVTGVVEERGGAVNKNLATGEIELRVKSLRVLSEAEVRRKLYLYGQRRQCQRPENAGRHEGDAGSATVRHP